jgi:hypothetical protein
MGLKERVTTIDFNAYEPYFFLENIYHVVALLNMAFLSIYTLAQNMTKILGAICRVSYIHIFLIYIYIIHNLVQKYIRMTTLYLM